MNNVYSLLSNYNGTNAFINSLKYQASYKSLSPKQIECAAKFFGLSTEQELNVPVQPKVFTYKKGDALTIRKHFANVKAKELNMKVFFRNVIVEEVLDETKRAVQIKVSFSSKLTTYCHCCGLNLDTEISKATGIGPVCIKKYLGFKRVTMADAPAILVKLEEETKALGTTEAIWIPKSQIVTKAEQVLFGTE